MKLGGSKKTVVMLACLTALACGIAAPAALGAKKKPEVRYSQHGVDQSNTANYRMESGVDRADKVVLKLRESPNQGEVTGPTERLTLTQDDPDDSSIWAVSIPRTREAPCYRGAVVATNSRGSDKRVYRYCIFYPSQTPTVTLLKP